jgi:uncharacterized membrane protein
MNLVEYDWFFRYGHIMAGIFWMGLLWFFNVINVGFQKQISADVKKDIYPKLMEPAMWWFRWSAMTTLVFGLVLLEILRQARGSLGEINVAIWLGMLIAIVMWFNVWFVIWPRQKKIIGGFKGENPAPGPEVAKVAARASRFNAWMSIPMILMMVLSAHMGGHFPTLNQLFG